MKKLMNSKTKIKTKISKAISYKVAFMEDMFNREMRIFGNKVPATLNNTIVRIIKRKPLINPIDNHFRIQFHHKMAKLQVNNKL